MSNHPHLRNIKYTAQYFGGVAPMHATITINPENVNYLVVPRFQRVLHNRGYHIRGGEWDTRRINQPLVFNANHNNLINRRGILPFNNFELYQSMKKRFLNGCSWEKTAYYRWEKKMYKKGLRNSSESEIITRCERIDKLFESIQQNGYQTQNELNKNAIYPEQHEIMIDIGRHGQLFLDDGRHRLCIAKILNLESIPVKVLVRHKMWQKRRTQAAQCGVESINECYRKHPDLSNIS